MAKVLVEERLFTNVYGSIVNEGVLRYLFNTKKEAYEYLEKDRELKKIRKDYYEERWTDEDGLENWFEIKVSWTTYKWKYVCGKELHLVTE